MAAWMIDNGSDVHQGGDGPLMRAALNGDRVPMMALLVARGASVNAMWDGKFPIIFASCEAVDPAALTWLLEHGADPNVTGSGEFSGTALDYVIGSYSPFAKAWRVYRCPPGSWRANRVQHSGCAGPAQWPTRSAPRAACR